MKCTDCLPLLEEFFDGETDEKTGASMTAHLASCRTCAEAFDALRAEQELFLRYERELDVSPALWQGVRERITTETPEPRSNFLLRLREQLAAALAVFQMRPAFASSLALLLVGVAVGSLWYANTRRPEIESHVADTGLPTPAPIPDNSPLNPTPMRGLNPVATAEETGGGQQSTTVAASTYGGPAHLRERPAGVQPTGARSPRGTGEVVDLAEAVHHTNEDPLPSIQVASLNEADLVDAAAKLDPADEAVARHVERAQLLLRSFKNTRPTEDVGDIAYERELSRKLLDENISLQLDAEAAGNKTAKRILTSLEPFLLDISNLHERPSRGDVRSIRERMEKQEIIAALHVYDD